MTFAQRFSLFLLRISLGWLMFYAGITKILNPEWSARGYLGGAATFTSFYQWLASPNVLPFIDAINEWGLTFLGISLILGLYVRLSASLGAVLMILYYFPVLQFPHVPPHSYLVDEHVVYALALVVLAVFRSGRMWGLHRWASRLPYCRRFPKLMNWLG